MTAAEDSEPLEPFTLLRAARGFVVAPSAALFLCLFASQAGILVLSPILVEVAREFGVSTASAGQLRTVTGLVAGSGAFVLGRFAGRVALRDLLIGGALLLAAGSLLSALAPTFWFLALAQVPTGVAVATLLSAGVAGAGEWAAASERARVLSWALVGQAAAWIVGMPVIGAVAELNWRLAFAVPLVASLLTAFVLSLCTAGPPAAAATGTRLVLLLRERVIRAWVLGELLAFSAWAGILVFAGALFIESYRTSTTTTGIVLGAIAFAYIPGNFLARRFVEHSARTILISSALAAAVGAALFGTVRPALAISALILGVLGFLAGGRTLAGSAFGLDVAPELKLAVMGLRAAALQFGYLVGSGVGGIALSLSGYGALGLALALLFAAAAVPHLVLTRTERTRVAVGGGH